jgi:hypothetical protein
VIDYLASAVTLSQQPSGIETFRTWAGASGIGPLRDDRLVVPNEGYAIRVAGRGADGITVRSAF